MITGRVYSNIFFLEHAIETTMAWYIVFRGRKTGVYESWGVCSEYVIGFSCATFQSCSTRMQAEEAYKAFLEHIT
jgi:viroplasmin and RNaseH domain-containing protein